MHGEGKKAPEVFAQHLLMRRLDSGGRLEFYEAQPEASPGGPPHFLVRLPAGEVRWPPWADPTLAKILIHPNIVQMLDCRVFDERPYAVLEYVPGLDLRELMACGRLPADVSCFVVAEVCRGLIRALDSRFPDGGAFKWAHGQLCPRAIHITPEGCVKVSGFGLGRLKPERPQVPGSQLDERLAFLAPEQAAGLVYDEATPEVDVFQLGTILHALLSSERLIAKESAIDYLREVMRMRKEARTFSRLDGKVSEPLAQAASKMLASDPKHRFADAGAVLDALIAVPEMRDGPSLAAKLSALVKAALSGPGRRADAMPRKCIVQVRQGDLTEGDSLVLVNASNTNGALGTGVSGAIRRACGKGFQARIEDALRAKCGGPMEPGDVLVTDAGSHPRARFVAHLAVMDYRNGFNAGSFPTEQTIERCCGNLWAALEELATEYVSVAMVALGAGTGQLGVRRPTEIACRTLKSHLSAKLDSKIREVTFFGYELPEYVVVVEVVSKFFDLPDGSVPPEILDLTRQWKKES